ncbi:rhomboid family intramembrane serine protease [Chiayiivirga flava]|uniref:Membrane associated rhomboid family serine protease n=1 Tax=Chiayiivirga flava TaxID=659595 RepID=A0A7W8D5I2_9GAMM|nr:rhomboid family intramembrane serine protease [Chiayiivirga flava]MBB5206643.1 membrane associated rhomboid family serine protease [Chiayiivirga flava]
MPFQLSATIVLIIVTAAVSWFAWKNPRLMERLILWPPAIARRKEYWRLVTYGFVHADPMHLLFNMITLFFFGRFIEGIFANYFGPVGFVLFYLSALVVSILPSYMRHRDDPNYRSLGASGAVAAVLFAFILVQPWALIFIPIPVPAILYAVGYVGYSIWMDRQGRDNVNHSAHLWGGAYGLLFFILLEPRVLQVFLRALVNPSFG